MAVWAPNVFLSIFCLILFCFSKTGAVALAPFWEYCKTALTACYESAKAQVSTNMAFVKLDAIESTLSSTMKSDPSSVEARLERIENLLKQVHGGDPAFKA